MELILWCKGGINMKLSEYLKTTPEGTEVAVWDTTYDMECYFYNDKPGDLWEQAMWRLAEVLEIVSIENEGVVVNLCQVVERNLKALEEAELFIKCTVNAIMSDMPAIISGYVSEEWFDEFTKCLK